VKGNYNPSPSLLRRRKIKLIKVRVDDLKTFQRRVEAALWTYFPPAGPYTRRVRKAMEYSLFAGGKRIRPILCLMACKAVGGRTGPALPTACALEFIHTYSLIHDDLPALDNDDYRRGHLSCHKKFDESTAILAGDALLTEAFALLSRPGIMKTVPDRIRLKIIQEIAGAAGIQGMIAGQEADLRAEKKKVSLAFLHYIHSHKTGAMIKASLVCGGLIGKGTPEQVRSLKRYGEKIGLAFQIKDDLLNVEGKANVMGKKTGTDEKKAKATFPLLMGMEPSRKLGRELVEEARKNLTIFGKAADLLLGIGDYIFLRDR
jgi:geranylgeranyl diphosphate synthase, type II